MPRKSLPWFKDFPYHVTARANNREPFPGGLDFIWRTMTDELSRRSKENGLQVHAFVLMPNHFHLLASSPETPWSTVMQLALCNVTKAVNHHCGRWGRLFGSRYRPTVIQDANYYAHAFKYVHRNPVKAQLCASVAQYRYSTFLSLAGSGALPLKVTQAAPALSRFVPDVDREFAALEEWLNRPYDPREERAIRHALRKRTFEISAPRSRREPESA